MIRVAAFYHFTNFPDFRSWQKPLLDVCSKNEIKGTILLAEEGINSTLAGGRDGVQAVLDFIRADDRFANMLHKDSSAESMPFKRLKVRLKKEIVTLGVKVDPRTSVGTYVAPKDWNRLISDPEVVVVDTRNSYEYEVGTFQNSIDPQTNNFGEFPEFVDSKLSSHKDKKIAMFCTGGIRCEKATSLLLEKGFREVYHLEGGILKYLEEIPKEQSLWQGECFVFDERQGLELGLKIKQKP